MKTNEQILMENYQNIIVENDEVEVAEWEKWIMDANENDDNTYEYVDKKMKEANELFGGYGVEPLQDEDAYVNKYWYNTIALYVNMGDTYDLTILYDTENEIFVVTSMGDFYENWRNENESEEKEVTFNDLDESTEFQNFYVTSNSDNTVLCKYDKWCAGPEEEKVRWFRTHKAAKKYIEKKHFGNVSIKDNDDTYSQPDKEETETENLEENFDRKSPGTYLNESDIEGDAKDKNYQYNKAVRNRDREENPNRKYINDLSGYYIVTYTRGALRKTNYKDALLFAKSLVKSGENSVSIMYKDDIESELKTIDRWLKGERIVNLKREK